MKKIAMVFVGVLSLVVSVGTFIPAAQARSYQSPTVTAKCKDGTYSYSTHRRGTCSGHRGVRQWFVQ